MSEVCSTGSPKTKGVKVLVFDVVEGFLVRGNASERSPSRAMVTQEVQLGVSHVQGSLDNVKDKDLHTFGFWATRCCKLDIVMYGAEGFRWLFPLGKTRFRMWS